MHVKWLYDASTDLELLDIFRLVVHLNLQGVDFQQQSTTRLVCGIGTSAIAHGLMQFANELV